MSMHENLGRRHEIKGSTNRGFGLTVGGILTGIAILTIVLQWADGVSWAMLALLVFGLGLVLLGLFAPQRLTMLNGLWTKLGLLLFHIVNPVLLGVLFFGVITPIGILLKLFGVDSLRLKTDPAAASYWIERIPPGPNPKTMRDQF